MSTTAPAAPASAPSGDSPATKPTTAPRPAQDARPASPADAKESKPSPKPGDVPAIRDYVEKRKARPTRAFDTDPDDESALDRLARRDATKDAKDAKDTPADRPRDDQGRFVPGAGASADAATTPQKTVNPPSVSPQGKVKFGGREFDSLEAADQAYRTAVGRLSASDRELNELRNVTQQYQKFLRGAGLVDAEGMIQHEAVANLAKSAATASPSQGSQGSQEDFFARGIVDDDAVWQRVAKALKNPEEGPVWAIAYAVHQTERRLQSYHEHLMSKVLAERLGPMQQYLDNIQAVTKAANFIAERLLATDQSGQPLYADLKPSREVVAALTQVIDQLPAEIATTPLGFDYAVRVVREHIAAGSAAPAAPAAPVAPVQSNADALMRTALQRSRNAADAASVPSSGDSGPSAGQLNSATAQSPEENLNRRIARAGARQGQFYL